MDDLDQYRIDKVQEILTGLNQQQCAAVTYDYTKALQIIAGPGTGKTKVLTSRVAYLILNHGINPHNIIVTTFTNKAAKEMRDRLGILLKETNVRVSDIMIGTFHSICLRILGRFGNKVGLPPGWRIVDDKEMETIMTQMIQNMPDQIRDYAHSTARKVNLCLPKRESKANTANNKNKSEGPEWEVHQKLVKKHISRLKSNAILPEEYKRDSMHDPALAYFYETYQMELLKLNTLDFDDLLMFTFRLLTKERCLPWIEHVLVDEFQDTNSIQIDLMFLLARGNHHISRGLTVVGDPDQSIYAFRYALSHNFNEMVNKCPLECSQVILVENYRSSQKILDTSETLIKQQVSGRESRCPLRAQFSANIAPVYMNFPAFFLESPSIIKEILYLKALPNLFKYDDFAILVRKRKQIKTIEKSLIEFRIPYRIVRGRAFWELKEIIAMLNLIKCLISDNESIAIISSLEFPNRGFGDTSAERLRKAFADNIDKSAYETLKLIDQRRIPIDIPKKSREVVKSFVLMIDLCREYFDRELSKAIPDIFDTLYEKSGLKTEFLCKDGKKKSDIDESEPDFSNPRHKNIQLLKSYFVEFHSGGSMDNAILPDTSESQNSSLSVNSYILNFLNSLSLFGDTSTGDDDSKQNESGSVTVCTIHGAKGLEWPVVFIPGCEDNTIPAIFSDDKGQSDDEDEGDIDEGNDKKGKKNQSLEESIDEERRMFFVAQTRAKYLLYLSSVTDSDGPVPRVPSRFLTADVLRTTADHQQALDNITNVKTLYTLMHVSYPGDTNKFSIKQLLKDYKLFIDDRRERLYWIDNVIRSPVGLDLTRNKLTSTSLMSDFTTASTELQKEIQNNPKKFNSLKRDSSSLGSANKRQQNFSPQKNYAPTSYNNSTPGSPSKHKQFAPKRNGSDFGSPTKSRQFAPENSELAKKGLSGKLAQICKNEDQSESLVKTDPSSRNTILPRPRSIIDRKKKYMIKSQPINLNTISLKPMREIKEEYDLGNASVNTTASELLHNPNDLKVEEKPIIASAKILADAAKRQQNKNLKDSTVDNVKKEPSLSQFDIFSQLSRAKKKAKHNDSEVIIID